MKEEIKSLTKKELLAIAKTPALKGIAEEFPYEVARIRIEFDGIHHWKMIEGESDDGQRSYSSGIPEYNGDYEKI